MSDQNSISVDDKVTLSVMGDSLGFGIKELINRNNFIVVSHIDRCSEGCESACHYRHNCEKMQLIFNDWNRNQSYCYLLFHKINNYTKPPKKFNLTHHHDSDKTKEIIKKIGDPNHAYRVYLDPR